MNTFKTLVRFLLELVVMGGSVFILVLLINSLRNTTLPPLAVQDDPAYPPPITTPHKRGPFNEPPPSGPPLEAVQATLNSISGPTPTGTLHPALQSTGPYHTETPYPTQTPPPTATRRPGPTRTPIPPAIPPADAEGVIWYVQLNPVEESVQGEHRKNFSTYFHISMEPNGGSKGPPENLVIPEPVTQKLDLNQRTFWAFPSPTNRFWLIELPIPESGNLIYVLDHATNRIESPFDLDAVPGVFYGWHPDGQHFLHWRDGGPLQLVHAETFETTELVASTNVKKVLGAALSPDGRLVAYRDYYISEKGEYLGDFLWLVSTEGGDARPLPELGPIGKVYPSAWSPDSTRLVYSGSCVSQETGQEGGPLCLYDFRTGESQGLSIPFYSGDSVWSPDGRYLATTGYSQSEPPCADSRDSSEQCLYQGMGVYLKDMETGELRELAKGVFPVWSPDGSITIFLSNQSGAPEVWAFNIQSNELYQLTSDGQPKAGYLNWFREVGP